MDFRPKDREGKAINEIPHKIIFLCPKYVNDKTPAHHREWLEAIDDSLDNKVDETKYKNPAIQSVFKAIEEDQTTNDEYARMFKENSERKLYEEGMEKGNKEGKKENAMENAVKMHEKGADSAFIKEITGISYEEIEEFMWKKLNS